MLTPPKKKKKLLKAVLLAGFKTFSVFWALNVNQLIIILPLCYLKES